MWSTGTCGLATLPDDILHAICFHLLIEDIVTLGSTEKALRQRLVLRSEFLRNSFACFWDISKLPQTFLNYVKDAKAIRLLNVREANLTRPLPCPTHIWIDLFIEMRQMHPQVYMVAQSHLGFTPSNAGMTPSESIGIELMRQYPFMSTHCISQYAIFWETLYAGPPTHPVEIVGGMQSARLYVYLGTRINFPGVAYDYGTELDENMQHIAVIYQSGDNFVITANTPPPRYVVMRWTNASDVVAKSKEIIELFYDHCLNNPHLSRHAACIQPAYWDSMENHFFTLQTATASLPNVLGGKILPYLTTKALSDIGNVPRELRFDFIRFCDSTLFDHSTLESKTKESFSSYVAMLRLTIRALHYLMIDILAYSFDYKYYGENAPFQCWQDVFLRGTTPLTSWRSHPPRELGVAEERSRCKRRVAIGPSNLSVRTSHIKVWPLWAHDLMCDLAWSVAALCSASIRINLLKHNIGDVNIEVLSNINALEAAGIDTSRVRALIKILRLESCISEQN